MSNNRISILTLSNGMRAVHMHLPGSPVAYAGVAVRAGSRDECCADQYGLAHFVEHTIFKGTTRRSSWHIINRMEAVGGELNAFTTKEDTTLYSVFPRTALPRALDLMTDLILNSRFPKAEIDKERDVICDEINSYLDQPADAVYDEFEDMLYAGTPLGHNILGTLDSVAAIDSDLCRRWLDLYYTASNMVAFYAGPAGADAFVHRAEPTLGRIPIGIQPKPDIQTMMTGVNRFHTDRKVDTHQAHTVMGCALPVPDMRDKMALVLLTNILGGPGMNSRFNIALRERRGLVYNVESNLSTWCDGCMFTTYFGTDPEDNNLCISLVNDGIADMADNPLTGRSLAAAKKQYLGQQILARANAENNIISTARAILLRGHAMTYDETAGIIADITPDDLCRAALSISNLSRLSLT